GRQVALRHAALFLCRGSRLGGRFGRRRQRRRQFQRRFVERGQRRRRIIILHRRILRQPAEQVVNRRILFRPAHGLVWQWRRQLIGISRRRGGIVRIGDGWQR